MKLRQARKILKRFAVTSDKYFLGDKSVDKARRRYSGLWLKAQFVINHYDGEAGRQGNRWINDCYSKCSKLNKQRKFLASAKIWNKHQGVFYHERHAFEKTKKMRK